MPTKSMPQYSRFLKIQHVDLLKLNQAKGAIAELKALVKSIHPWSALHHGMTGLDMVLRLYTKTIPHTLERILRSRSCLPKSGVVLERSTSITPFKIG